MPGPDHVCCSPLRRVLLRACAVALMAAMTCDQGLGRQADGAPGSDPILQALLAAGNAEDEATRLQQLRMLRERSGLDAAIRADLDQLLPLVTAWAEGKTRPVPATDHAAENGYLCHFITGAVRPAASGEPVVPVEISAGSPLRPLWCYYRARMRRAT